MNVGTTGTNINNLIETNAAGANACGTPAITTDPGLGALANHIGGDTGAALAAAERRLAERRDRQPSRVDIAVVRDIASAIELDADRDDLDTNRGERWVRDVIIDKIPGAGDAAE